MGNSWNTTKINIELLKPTTAQVIKWDSVGCSARVVQVSQLWFEAGYSKLLIAGETVKIAPL